MTRLSRPLAAGYTAIKRPAHALRHFPPMLMLGLRTYNVWIEYASCGCYASDPRDIMVCEYRPIGPCDAHEEETTRA